MPTALVTGTSTGIGYATAIHLARNGYKTYATMRSLEKGAPLREVAETESLPLELLALDVTDETSMSNGVARVLAADGRIDVLVNNAGIGEASPLEFLDQTLLRNMMETNFFGAVRMMQLVLPSMREQQSGTIVNITSLSGLIAFPAHGAYCASKFALEAMAEAVAAEVARFNVRIANIEPGCVATPIFDKADIDSAIGNLPPGFPYKQAVARLVHVLQQGLKDPALVQDVADVVLEAIQTDEPRLRYPVGKDAHEVLAGLGSLSDDERLALLGEAEDDVYQQRTGALMPYLLA